MNRILIVDDAPGVRESFIETFRDRYDILSASSGEEAIDAVRKHPVDLMLLDIKLPGMSGLDVLKLIREKESVLPVVIITGMEEIGHVRQAFRYGVSDYLIKPFGWDDIKGILKKNVLQGRPCSQIFSRGIEKLIETVKGRMINENATLDRAKGVFEKEFSVFVEEKSDSRRNPLPDI